MDCYECAIRGEAISSTGMCLKCGAGLCLDHLSEAARYTIGGLPYACPHHLEQPVVTRHTADGHIVAGPEPALAPAGR